MIEAGTAQIRQLFENHINNSLRYGNDCVKADIRLYGDMSGGMSRIFVGDNGIGFEERYVDLILWPSIAWQEPRLWWNRNVACQMSENPRASQRKVPWGWSLLL
jgi:hypothetical protein